MIFEPRGHNQIELIKGTWRNLEVMANCGIFGLGDSLEYVVCGKTCRSGRVSFTVRIDLAVGVMVAMIRHNRHLEIPQRHHVAGIAGSRGQV